MKKNQKGFGAVEIILIIVIIGILGFVGWYVWNAQKKTNTSLDNASKSQPEPQKATPKSSTTPDASYLKVSEWGIKMAIPSELTSVTYTIDKDTLVINSNQQKALTTCGSGFNPQIMWGLYREAAGSLQNSDGSKMTDADANKNPAYKHVGAYYYHRKYPPIGCETESQKMDTLDGANVKMFNSLVKN